MIILSKLCENDLTDHSLRRRVEGAVHYAPSTTFVLKFCGNNGGVVGKSPELTLSKLPLHLPNPALHLGETILILLDAMRHGLLVNPQHPGELDASIAGHEPGTGFASRFRH